jgi:hypothetical protein
MERDEQSTITWDSSRAIAIIINEKFPDIDVLSLSDAKLMGMLKKAGVTDLLPEIPRGEKEDILFCIKCALARIIEDDEDYNAHQNDALV